MSETSYSLGEMTKIGIYAERTLEELKKKSHLKFVFLRKVVRRTQFGKFLKLTTFFGQHGFYLASYVRSILEQYPLATLYLGKKHKQTGGTRLLFGLYDEGKYFILAPFGLSCYHKQRIKELRKQGDTCVNCWHCEDEGNESCEISYCDKFDDIIQTSDVCPYHETMMEFYVKCEKDEDAISYFSMRWNLGAGGD